MPCFRGIEKTELIDTKKDLSLSLADQRGSRSSQWHLSFQRIVPSSSTVCLTFLCAVAGLTPSRRNTSRLLSRCAHETHPLLEYGLLAHRCLSSDTPRPPQHDLHTQWCPRTGKEHEEKNQRRLPRSLVRHPDPRSALHREEERCFQKRNQQS